MKMKPVLSKNAVGATRRGDGKDSGSEEGGHVGSGGVTDGVAEPMDVGLAETDSCWERGDAASSRATAVAAAALSTVVFPVLLRGISPDVREEMTARDVLQTVAEAEKQYKLHYGQYGSLEDLRNRGLFCLDEPSTWQYTFEVTVQGDTFTATASHKERPQTRRSFVVGPDGVVKAIGQ